MVELGGSLYSSLLPTVLSKRYAVETLIDHSTLLHEILNTNYIALVHTINESQYFSNMNTRFDLQTLLLPPYIFLADLLILLPHVPVLPL
jgi:hypothetical protein